MGSHLGYQLRIYPTDEQKEMMQFNLNARRFVYNHFLALRRDKYKNEHISLYYKDTSKLLTQMKREEEYSWLQQADSMALQEALRDLDKAYINFFKKLARYPRFKSKNAYAQSYRTRNQSDGIRIIDNSIRIPKIGLVKTKLTRPIDGRIVNATITKTSSNKYYASLCVECEAKDLPHKDGVIGIDMGVKDFCVTSNGDFIASHIAWRHLECQLKKAHRAVSKKEKGSKNYIKAVQRLAITYEKIANTRRDFQHKLSNKLCAENAFIACESLKIANLLHKNKHRGAKSIAQQGWGQFLTMLEYKSMITNTVFVKVDTYFPSSQLCNCCGYKNPQLKDPKIRQWTCPVCGTHHDRDWNAAINILKEGLRIYEESEAPDEE